MGLTPTYLNKSFIRDYISENSHKLAQDKFLLQFIRSLPYVTALLDKNRRIVLSNNVKLEEEYEFRIEEFFGRTPGEVLNCIHYRKPYGACDGKGVCQYCGLPNAILRAENSGKKATQETSITIQLNDNKEVIYDILVTAAPFFYDNERYIILTINDISEQKRKRVLERVFFHDILNKTGSLSGIYELLQKKDQEENKDELIKLSEEVIKDLQEEIILQKNLMAAESGDLSIKSREVSSGQIIDESLKQVVQYPESQNIIIETDKETVNEQFVSDPTILKRILINMLKNALEASKNNQKVTIGCNSNDHWLYFWVHNYAYIPREIQIKLFERTFSTKSEDRGLGTYSMKLLGEKYLGGKITYTTHETKGTTFTFKLPKNKKATQKIG